jgi:hypothetical protein
MRCHAMLDQAPLSSTVPAPEPFTLAGTIREWDPQTRRLRILNLDIILAAHLSPDGLESDHVVFVKGHHDQTTGQRIATRLRRN